MVDQQKVLLEVGSLTSPLLAGEQVGCQGAVAWSWRQNFHADSSSDPDLGSGVGLVGSRDQFGGGPCPELPVQTEQTPVHLGVEWDEETENPSAACWGDSDVDPDVDPEVADDEEAWVRWGTAAVPVAGSVGDT